MVFFTCDQCGESLKKNQVEKHTYKCRSQSYSCIDCQVCFTPYTYQQHVKCITENQKYGSKNYVEKEAKGEVKQNAWCEQVERAIEFVKDPRLRSLLQNIQGYNNIPRKEAKFINFLTNSCRIRDQTLCRMAWKAIADEAEKLKKENEASKSNGKVETTGEATPSKENRQKEENGTNGCNNNEGTPTTVNFKWKSTIKRKLREAGGEMKVKKLRKAVVSAYKEAVGDEEGADELFESKLAKSGVSVSGKLVSLQS
uniref:Zf-LYAR domain-containing protein n=1 Tax=Haemonchus contortus TaxID=6289 RepID=A0A7I5E9H8_HAECO